MARLIDQVQHGDKVTIVTCTGDRVTGRAVMKSPAIGGWVLNTGGKHGNTALADDSNTVKVQRPKK